MKIISPEKAKFVAIVEGVRELRLIGSADLDFWNGRLAGKPFRSFDAGGFAEIVVSATELVWKGFKFNEATVSLAVADHRDAQKQVGYYLLHAFNSNRFFAFCERTFFSTPYFFGRVGLRETMPCSLTVRSNDQTGFDAEMSAAARPVEEADESWEGAVFLPGAAGRRKYFIARLAGRAKIWPVDETDRIELRGGGRFGVFEALADSGLRGREWRARSRAFHAKSKTYDI
jgi:hypothetical protein